MSSNHHETRPPRHPDLTLTDLTDALLWPRLFDAGRLAMRPERMFFGLLTVVLIGLLGSMSLLWSDEPSFGQSFGALLGALSEAIGSWMGRLSIAQPWDVHLGELAGNLAVVWQEAVTLTTVSFPVSSIVLGLPMLAVGLIGWAAIARSAAWEFGIGVTESGPVLLAVAVRRLPTLLGAVLGLPVFVGVVALGMGIVGWLLIGLPVLDVLGALLFGAALLVALVLVPVLAAWALGFPMLAPAVMCEGPDTFEAIQRGMAFVFGRPIRFVIYSLTLIALGAVLVGVLVLLLAGADALATGAMAMFLDESRAAVVTGIATDDLEGTAVAAARIISFWKATATLILGSFVVSYFASASSVLYLLLRKLNDGQDPGDLAAEIRH